MKNEVLAEHLRFFKETEEGQEELSEVDARSVARGEIRGETRGETRGEAKGFVKGELSMVTKLILTNKVPLELLAATSGLSVDELKKIKNSLLNPA
jgi:hypothetical protein